MSATVSLEPAKDLDLLLRPLGFAQCRALPVSNAEVIQLAAITEMTTSLRRTGRRPSRWSWQLPNQRLTYNITETRRYSCDLALRRMSSCPLLSSGLFRPQLFDLSETGGNHTQSDALRALLPRSGDRRIGWRAVIVRDMRQRRVS